jgi:uncharacterized surface protein with fasciclin (FAS1) repeats/predicted lipoprotein with Yx(FWY)xxD motif
MKTNKFTFLMLMLLLLPFAAFSQTARVQVIHNSADLAAQTVDVYLDGTRIIDDFEFRTASAFIDAPAGSPIDIDIAPGTSSSSTESIYNLNTTLSDGETYILVASGIVSDDGYSPATPFEISVFNMGMETGSDPSKTDILVYHGVTDAPKVGVWAAPSSHWISPFEFGEFAAQGYLDKTTDDYILEVRDEAGGTTVASYSAPLSTLELENTPIVVVASGFLSPADNSNGPVFGLYVALPAGGDLVQLPYAYSSRLQVVHNSADAAAEMVDVYLNDGLLIDDFEFRTASAFIDAPAGAPVKINVAPSNSSSSLDAIYTLDATLEKDETYVGIASGIVSETGYTPASPFGIDFFDMGREEASTSGNTDLLVYHGSTDAPTVDIFEATGPANLVDNIMFGDYSSNYLELTNADYFLQVRTDDGTTPLFAYDAPLSALNLQDSAIVAVASGFVDPSANSDGPAFGLYVALPEGGDLVELPSSTARVQVIHNSADLAADSVDVYLNDELLIDNFAFRTASSFIDAPANVQIEIDIAPKNSADASESIYNLPTTLEADEKYILVASGIVSAEGYAPATPFEISVFNMGMETGSDPAKTDVLVYHGSTDAPTVDIYESTAGELVDNASFGDFAGYLDLDTDDYTLEVRDETGATTVASYAAPLNTLALQETPIVVVASGFLTPADNSNGSVFGLYVALPSGGELVQLPYAYSSRLQVVHNSADAAAEMVDVYLNDGLLIDDFEFRTASAFIDAPAGAPVKINVAPSNSVSSLDAIYTLGSTLEKDKTYIGIASGIVSGSGYSPAESFDIDFFDMGQEAASSSGNTDVLVYHGSTDAPTVDIYESTAGELVDNASFGDFAGYLNLPTADYLLEVRDESGSNIVRKYSAPLATLGLEDSATTVIASGFFDPTVNSDGPAFGLYASLASGGSLVELPPYTVKDVIVNSDVHTTLETAVIEAELDDDLSSPGKFTVFAPTDDAFSALPAGLLDELLADPTGNLAQILLYHVAGDSVRSTGLTDEMMITTLQGQDVTVDLDGGVFINGAEVTVADIKADNGIVHVIDAVLVPEYDVKLVDANSLGTIVASNDSMTLYFFTKDVNDTSVCVDGCIANWPAFYTSGLFLPEGLDHDDFGSFKRPDGSMQSTYKGWPLYYFANDAQPGDVTGEGVNDVWFVAKPDYTIMLMDNQLVGNDGKNYTGDYTEGEEIVQYFTDDKGYTLYTWINDANNTNKFTNEDFSNNNIWPIYEESEVIVPSTLDSDMFGVIDVYGRNQMTYNGWPLYYFGTDDMMRGSTKGVSVPVPGVWPVAVEDIGDPIPATVVDIVVASEAHDTLESAVIAAELADDLSGDGPFTVFAPTDDAFGALPAGTLDDLLADPTGDLAEILQYHVVSGKVMSGDLEDGMKVETLLGDSIMIEITDGNVFVNGAQVIIPDLEAGNGVVHVIDAVLLPPVPETVVDIVVNSDVHETLETAVIAAELADDLSGDGPFTVFAPTDDAFGALPAGTLDDLLADPTGDLAEILQYHVVSGKVMSGDLEDGMKVETLLGDSIMIEITDGNVFVNGAQVIIPDLEAGNGVVHVIDAVLLPDDATNTELFVFEDDNFNVYPNPASSLMNIRFSLKERAEVSIEIYNILGTKVKTGVNGVVMPTGTNQHQVDVTDLETGIYFVILRSGKDQITQSINITK